MLVTGLPAIESATDAVEYGAFKYIVKPFEPEVLRNAVERARKLYRLARMKREALKLLGANAISADRAGPRGQLRLGARARCGWRFSPSCEPSDGSVFGYEALLRTEEPTLIRPDLVVDAAERLDALPRLGRKVRALAAARHERRPRPTPRCSSTCTRSISADEELFDAWPPRSRRSRRASCSR